MGKLKLSEADYDYIYSYVKYMEPVRSHDFLGGLIIGNIFVLFTAIYQLKFELLPSVILGVICIGYLFSWIFYLVKVEHTKKNYILYLGIFSIFSSFSLNVLGYVLISDYLGKYKMIVAFFIIIVVFLLAIFTIVRDIRLICCGYYSTTKPKGVNYILIAMCSVLGVCIPKDNIDFIVVFAIGCNVLGIAFASCISFLLKYKCYCILDNENDKSVL